MYKNLMIFAGTIEGRLLAEYVSDKNFANRCIFSVATEYGNELIKEYPNIKVIEGRMNSEAIKEVLIRENCEAVIDATHPYAKEVTLNIKNATSCLGLEYVRLLRDEVIPENEDVITMTSMKELCEYINSHDENFLITTGSKELHILKDVIKKEKLVVRVLPSVESIKLCKDAGILSKNIVAMQGPFTLEMNLATLNQYNCTYLVTKSTGKQGGFDDKVECCKKGYKLVVIKRPMDEDGLSFDQCKKKVVEYFGK